MEEYLNHITLPQLRDSASWVKFIDEFARLLVAEGSGSSSHILGKGDYTVLKSLIDLLSPGAIPMTEGEQRVTESALFPFRYTESPALVLLQAVRAKLPNFYIEFTFDDGERVKEGYEDYVIGDVLHLLSLETVSNGQCYYRYSSNLKELLADTDFVVSDTEIKILGVNKSLICLPQELSPFDEEGNPIYYPIHRTKARLRTRQDKVELLSSLAYSASNIPLSREDFLRRTIPARCQPLAAAEEALQFIDILAIRDSFIHFAEQYLAVTDRSYVPQEVFNIGFYQGASVVVVRRFAQGYYCQITLAENNFGLAFPSDFDYHDDVAYTLTMQQSNTLEEEITIPATATLYNTYDEAIQTVDFSIVVAAYNPYLIPVEAFDRVPSLYDWVIFSDPDYLTVSELLSTPEDICIIRISLSAQSVDITDTLNEIYDTP